MRRLKSGTNGPVPWSMPTWVPGDSCSPVFAWIRDYGNPTVSTMEMLDDVCTRRVSPAKPVSTSRGRADQGEGILIPTSR